MILQRQFLPELSERLRAVIQSWGLEDWTVVATDSLDNEVTRSIFLHREGALMLLVMFNNSPHKITLRDCPGWDSELLDRLYWLVVSDDKDVVFRLVSRNPLEIIQEATVLDTETTSLPNPA